MTNYTAKWRYTNNGISHERIIDTDQVHHANDYRPPNRPAVSEKLGIYDIPPGGIVVLGNPHDGSESMALTFGTVYIVNEVGKTVATYNLADKPAWETVLEASVGANGQVGRAQPVEIKAATGSIQGDGSVLYDGLTTMTNNG